MNWIINYLIEMRVLIALLLITVGIAFVSCDSNQQSGYLAAKKNVKKETVGKSMEKVNRYLLEAENKEIDGYVRRHRWKMKTTGTGLRYEVYKQGTGQTVKKGDHVVLNYKTFLINGNLIYTSDVLGKKVFEVGHGGVERGLEEAILFLHKGDKAHVILPSHLAFGLNGDGDRIPKRAIVIYDVELIDIK